MQGRYAVTDSAITFTPLFPFDPGREYRVVFDPVAASSPASVGGGHRRRAPSGRGDGADDRRDRGAPGGRRRARKSAARLHRVLGADGQRRRDRLREAGGARPAPEKKAKTRARRAGAFLPVEANFWSPDHTRYTLFFDPGRVKDDILPNRQSGRPLRAGHSYALDIASAWTDANGLPLKAGYRHLFRVGPAVDEAIRLSDWTIARPAPGTRDRLVVRFPAAARPRHSRAGARRGNHEPARRLHGEDQPGVPRHRLGLHPGRAVAERRVQSGGSVVSRGSAGESDRPGVRSAADERKNDRPLKPGYDDDVAFRVAFTIGAP